MRYFDSFDTLKDILEKVSIPFGSAWNSPSSYIFTYFLAFIYWKSICVQWTHHNWQFPKIVTFFLITKCSCDENKFLEKKSWLLIEFEILYQSIYIFVFLSIYVPKNSSSTMSVTSSRNLKNGFFRNIFLFISTLLLVRLIMDGW